MSYTKKMIGLDFETYAATDLIVNGLDNYVNCPFFRPLVAAVAYSDAGKIVTKSFDFVDDYAHELMLLKETLNNCIIVAHNAGFEQAVLKRMGIDLPSESFIDSAVLARAAGAAGKLEAAAPQLLGGNKLESGFGLIKLFSIPGEYQARSNSMAFNPRVVEDHLDDWSEFIAYCVQDAVLSFQLGQYLNFSCGVEEHPFNTVTMDMNNTGWFVDIPLVEEMQRQYHANVEQAVEKFRIDCDAPDLNLASFQQLQKWCEDRGVKAKSFDEAAVEKLLASLYKRMASKPNMDEDTKRGYQQVIELLLTKQTVGGSSLKKLQTILDRTGSDGRLRDQYLHVGAGATRRTSGRGVQLQNLKRLNGQGDDVELLFDPAVTWPNDRLAANLRQVFRATDDNGQLIVGDFSSVESRGLAWQSGEQWKLDAYAHGHDLYKVQAGLIFNKPVDQVTKSERQIGKVGELACGYGAGPDAVRDFAAKMGVSMTQHESAKLVRDWRSANDGIVHYWHALNDGLHTATGGAYTSVSMAYGTVEIEPVMAPASLRQQTDDVDLVSLQITMRTGSKLLFNRVIHGAHLKGRNVGYWKPSERKTGDLWVDRFTNPKTKQVQPYTVYGGKLAGLLTQSLCREIFFTCLLDVHEWVKNWDNVQLIGQFHDEIVLDWAPQLNQPGLATVMSTLNESMTRTTLPDFPLAAEIKHDFRYTK
jgi:DNA polymerase